MTYRLSGGSAQPKPQQNRSPSSSLPSLFDSFWNLLSTNSVNKRGPETPDSQNKLFRT